jgi:hypothetical protein
MVLHHYPAQRNYPVAVGSDRKVHGIGRTFLRQARTIRVTEVATVSDGAFVRNTSFVTWGGAVAVKSVTERKAATKRPQFTIVTIGWIKKGTGHAKTPAVL